MAIRIAFADFSGWDFHALTVDGIPMGGSQSAACYLARALVRQGQEIFLLSNTSAPGQYDGVNCLAWSNFTDLTQLRTLQFDVLVCILTPVMGLKLRAALPATTRLILWNQHAHDQPTVAILREPQLREVFDGFAMVSDWQRTQYQQHFGIDPSRMAILHNAIAPAFADLFPPGTAIQAQKTSPPILAYTSTPFRGLELLLEAFPQIRAAIPGTRLQVFSSMKVYQVSPAQDEADYGALYQRCRQTEGVEYIGALPQPELAQALRQAMVLAYPNTFAETSCIAVMEAMACGCRIVTSNLGALPETAAGFAQLIPANQGRDSYRQQFVAETIQILNKCMQSNAETEDLLRRQITHINTTCTWAVRAREWISWLGTLTAHVRTSGGGGGGFNILNTPPQQTLQQAIAHHQAGRLAEAEKVYQQILSHQPNNAEALHLLGILAYQVNRYDVAGDLIRRAIAVNPSVSTYHSNLGKVLADHGQLEAAVAACRTAIQLKPDSAEAWYNLGHALREQGLIDEGMAAFRKALEFNPNFAEIRSCILLTLHLLPQVDAQALYEEHRLWNQQYAEPLKKLIQPHTNDCNPERKIRIGYVSPDLWDHAIGRGLMPLLANHDHNQFEIVCYADMLKQDNFTQQFRSHADIWHNVAELSDAQLVQLVRQDRIDILVDVALHSSRNRLLAFAQKPAPVQVTFAGYPSTTGLTTIDYRLTDPYLDPPGKYDAFYSEQSIRLPDSFWCYSPLSGSPPVNALPALKNGYVTFSCLTKFCKINDQVLNLWARVLQAVEHSHIMILADPGDLRQLVLNKFGRHGITPDRIEFHGRRAPQQYLALYNQADLTLDTFPYNGHITALDSLWMGVPIITLPGSTTVSRGGQSILSNIGLIDLIAQTPEQYIALAATLAHDLPRLSTLRSTLRNRMLQSPLMNTPRFAHNIESAYRTMWRKWSAEVG